MKQETYDCLYARYSSHAQDESTSIALQVEACERAAGANLARFVDEAKTGRSQAGRPELLRMIAEARAGRIGTVYVYRYDRFGRAAETHVLCQDLDDLGVKVVSVCEGTNELARGVNLVVAQEYSRALASRTRAGLVQRHREGRWTGGMAPFGYRVEQRRLVVDEAEGAIVREIFAMYLGEAIGIREVARRLREKGRPSRLGKAWCPQTVRCVLTNSVAVGVVVFGRKTFRINRTTGRRVWKAGSEPVRRAQEDLRLVSDADFARAQAKLAEASQSRPRGVAQVRPLSRRIRCATCGAACSAQKSAKAGGWTHWYYGCSRRRSTGADVCSNTGSVREDRVLARIGEAFRSIVAGLDGAVDEVQKRAEAILRRLDTERERSRASIVALDRKISALASAMVEMDRAGRAALGREISALEQQRDQVIEEQSRAGARGVIDAAALAEDCRWAVTEAVRTLVTGTPAAVNSLIETAVGPLELGPDGVVRLSASGGIADSANRGWIAGIERTLPLSPVAAKIGRTGASHPVR